MKTISFKLSKKLIPYLENIDTEYYYEDGFVIEKGCVDLKNYKSLGIIKTLTFEEAINFILFHLTNEDSLQLGNNYICFFIKGKLILDLSKLTLSQAIEKLLEYLLDNKLLNND